MLESGNKLLIQDAKRRYWADYKKQWRRAKRAQSKVFTIYLDPKEYKCIGRAIAKSSTSLTRFIKQAALAMAQQATALDPATIGLVRECLALCCTDLEELLQGNGVSRVIEEGILDRMEKLEDEIIHLITHQKSWQ